MRNKMIIKYKVFSDIFQLILQGNEVRRQMMVLDLCLHVMQKTNI